MSDDDLPPDIARAQEMLNAMTAKARAKKAAGQTVEQRLERLEGQVAEVIEVLVARCEGLEQRLADSERRRRELERSRP